MAEKKMTKKDMFGAIIAVIEGTDYAHKDEAIKFLAHEIELLDHKSANSGMTKRQKENVEVNKLIKDALFEVAKPITITDLIAASPSLKPYTPQRISALLKIMKDNGEVIRTEDKKKAYFSLPVTDDTDVAEAV